MSNSLFSPGRSGILIARIIYEWDATTGQMVGHEILGPELAAEDDIVHRLLF